MFESRVKWPSSFKKNLVSYFCKILLKIILIRIIYRSAMATTSVLIPNRVRDLYVTKSTNTGYRKTASVLASL